ncbi:MAG TPA: hypothetical protein VFW50_10955 [Streptosporangiaceae bacterium]|nr:hypothetical protein [Streptosporangiaceae bacterium]
MDRVVVAVNEVMTAARHLGVQQLYVFTTSAVRDAANRDLILDRVQPRPASGRSTSAARPRPG